MAQTVKQFFENRQAQAVLAYLAGESTDARHLLAEVSQEDLAALQDKLLTFTGDIRAAIGRKKRAQAQPRVRVGGERATTPQGGVMPVRSGNGLEPRGSEAR